MDIRLQNVPLSEIGDTVGSPPTTRLASSVRKMGVIQPVLLAESTGETGEIEYLIIDGNRRVHAARKAKLHEIPGVVIAGIEAEERAQLTLVANGFRSPNYLTEFWSVKTLERTGFSLDEVMRIAGMSESVLATRRRLSHLHRDIFIGLRNSKVSQANAITIARMERNDQEYLASILSRTGRLLKRDVDNQLAEINKRSTSPRDPTVTVGSPHSVTPGIRFAQATRSLSSSNSTSGVAAAPVLEAPSGPEALSHPSVPTAHSRDQETVRHDAKPVSEEKRLPTNIDPLTAVFSTESANTRQREHTTPVSPSRPETPTTAARAVTHMRNAVIAAQVLDFSREEFLEMAARIWDDTVNQQAEKQFMQVQAPREPFPDLATHKWDTGET